jgi:diguanylate cyclase (GGDEF)-like protein/PAS domain S-box-containing protein
VLLLLNTTDLDESGSMKLRQTIDSSIELDQRKTEKQRHLRGLVGAVALSFAMVLWLAVGTALNVVPMVVVWLNLLSVCFTASIAYLAISSGYSARFRDSGLTKPLVLAATISVLGTAHYLAPNLRATVLPWLLIAFAFAAMTGRNKFLYDLAAWITALIVVEGVWYSFRFGQIEFLAWQSIAVVGTIISLAVFCGRINSLRATSKNDLKVNHAALHAMADAMIALSPTGTIVELNRSASQILGIEPKKVLGKLLAQVTEPFSDKDATILNNLALVRPDGEVMRTGARIKRRGVNSILSTVDLECVATSVYARNGQCLRQLIVLRDVSEMAKLVRKLDFDSKHDTLTGIFNRRAFQIALTDAQNSFKRYPKSTHHGLLIIDLDYFKVINDSCGHEAGDALIKNVVQVISDCLRDEDHFSRYGGDEFAVILYDVSNESVLGKAASIRDAVERLKFNWHGHKFQTGASIGCVMFDESDSDVAAVLRAADSALYLAKDLGRGRVQMHADADAQIAKKSRELSWAGKIHQAIDQNWFELHAQLVASNDPKHEEHFEILVRLREIDGTLVFPSDFIPAAERFNLMPALDRWVVTNALKQIHACQKRTGKAPKVAINLSPQSIRDQGFCTFLLNELALCGVPNNRICFELTETVAIADFELVKTFMNAIRQRGCTFALDDVGAGFNSFSYLKHLTFEQIKIDGHYVKNIDSDPVDCALVESLVRAAHSLGLIAVAEMVETLSVAQQLQKIGVRHLQGFGIHRPELLATILNRDLHSYTEEKVASVADVAEAI